MEKIIKINIHDIDDFQNHPFMVKEDDSLLELIESIKKNADKVLSYSKMRNIEVKYWDTSMTLLPDKASPSDYGADTLKEILNTELEVYSSETEVEHIS